MDAHLVSALFPKELICKVVKKHEIKTDYPTELNPDTKKFASAKSDAAFERRFLSETIIAIVAPGFTPTLLFLCWLKADATLR